VKLVALGDAHLGRSATTAVASDGVNQRERDFEDSFRRAVSEALATGPDLFVWLGDIFDHPRPSYRSFRVAMAALTEIRAHGVPLVAISGNHDTPRLPGAGNPYAVLADAFPEFRFAYQMAYECIDLPDIRIHAVPQARTAEASVEALREAGNARSTDRVNVLLTHPLVHSVERRYADVNEIEVDDNELQSDLVLLGHYHIYTVVRPGVWYAGSTDTFGFADDPDRPKGFISVDAPAGKAVHHGLSDQRKLYTAPTISAWGLSPAELEGQLAQAFTDAPGGSVTRVEVDGVDPDVYRLVNMQSIRDAAVHLLHINVTPRFGSTVAAVEDLPDLATLGARWQSFVSGQVLDDIDPEKVKQTGSEYLEAAIDRSVDSGTE
jgi:predicted phosphodiesterase